MIDVANSSTSILALSSTLVNPSVSDSKFFYFIVNKIRDYQNLKYHNIFIQTRTCLVWIVFSPSTGSETDLEQCILCSDMVCLGHMNDHLKRHKGLSANERKLLHNYYIMKENSSRLCLVWTGHRDEVFTKAVNETFDVLQKKGHTNENFKRSLLTFRNHSPPSMSMMQ